MTTPKMKRTKRSYRDAPPPPEPPVLDIEIDGPSEAEEFVKWRFGTERERQG
jgi:hypothetical protein